MTDFSDLKPHQVAGVQRLQQIHGKGGLWVDLGGGKTRIALKYSQTRSFQRILVVAPLSVTSVWEQEAGKVGFPLDTFDLTEAGTILQRTEMLKRIGSGLVIINPDSYWRVPLRAALLKWSPQEVIFDEVHRIRHRGARHSRFAHGLANLPTIQSRIGLSGTVITNGLQDAWSIYRFLQPAIFGTWKEFQQNYLQMGGYKDHTIIGYRNEEQAKKLIASAAFQWDDPLPSPPDTAVIVRLQPKTRALYEELRKEAIASVGDYQVSGRLQLTLMLRLQQLTSGFVREEGGETIDLKTYEKARAALELTEDAVAQNRRVVVFARFLWELDTLERGFSKKFRVTRIDGGVPATDRKKRIADFDKGEYDVILVQLRAAIGIDLASASVGIFISADHSLDTVLQAKGRLSGVLRQRHPVTFYHLIVEDTVDRKLYDGLLKKVNVAERLTDTKYALSFFGRD